LKNIKSIYYNIDAFVAITENGDIESGGGAGGDSSKIQHLLKNIKSIYSTDIGFIAIDENNNIITWSEYLEDIPNIIVQN